jgi:hypothetical protein
VIKVILLAFAIGWFQNNRFFWILAWPGTVIHEFLHWIVGLVLLAEPSRFSVIPKPPTDEGQVLGYVRFESVGWWNSLPIGLAPLLSVPVALYMAGTMQFAWTVGSVVLLWILASAIAQAWPSRTDWRIAFSNPVGVVVWAGLFYYVFTK